ncbi:MAG: phosphoribosylglycinamide synthetase C domain-containing protein, partial [Saprospiraceae bacterium]
LTDGKDYVLLPEAKDYKRIGEGDKGLNTGGMGAISPVPFVDKNMWAKVIERIVKPTIDGLYSEQMDYVGFVFFGLINVKGNPMVIEYNCRLGDPETEVILPRIENDLVTILHSAAKRELSKVTIQTSDKAAATIVMVSAGYPESYTKGKEICCIDDVATSQVFHSGTASHQGKILTNGGRVLAITSLHEDFRRAVDISLTNADLIQYEGKYYRRDIGFDL